jgi:hypothetical protein
VKFPSRGARLAGPRLVVVRVDAWPQLRSFSLAYPSTAEECQTQATG